MGLAQGRKTEEIVFINYTILSRWARVQLGTYTYVGDVARFTMKTSYKEMLIAPYQIQGIIGGKGLKM
tara:strand:- start:372 stop:575 length:204 start_codon:yes stop_codon:yes gene_type:complete